MPQYVITFIKDNESRPRTKKILGDRVSDIFKQVFEIEKHHTIISIENESLRE
ncbi:hypothetical protein [Bacillus sp. FJAT-27225]|uniref:hypothetical protein n=1 Tax=Bacillus sp. FJAT-27225 TaxID=1743144 RepID=UPI0015863637|nr:hypothetical protein [Bacillus sp. FJAT-27225]